MSSPNSNSNNYSLKQLVLVALQLAASLQASNLHPLPPSLAALASRATSESRSTSASSVTRPSKAPTPPVRSCSRALFGNEPIKQPLFSRKGKLVCIVCAVNCHPPSLNVAPEEPVNAICQCAFIRNHSCAFAIQAFTGSDLVRSEPEKERLKNLFLNPRATTAASLNPNEPDGPSSQSANMMLARLNVHSKTVFAYENPKLQAEARAVLPMDKLVRRAQTAMNAEKKEEAKDDNPIMISERDYLLKELLHWFKFEFFTWVNGLPCERCSTECKVVGRVPPTDEDRRYGAQTIEVHQCPSCLHQMKFPRYNNGSKLLCTRKGRCGEFTQSFMLFARTMGYETRMVFEWGDHVWCECYSEAQQRWLHCDPCEDRIDAPLLYESGWGKKLSYIIAFSIEEIVDVTCRYTRKWDEVSSRRTDCTEGFLAQNITLINALLRVSPERRAVLATRKPVEDADFLRAKQPNPPIEIKPDENQGRTTGSEEWRQARGELGDRERTEEVIREQEEIKEKLQADQTK